MNYTVSSGNRKMLSKVLNKNREVISMIEKFKVVSNLKNEYGGIVIDINIFDNALKELLLVNYKIIKILKETPKDKIQTSHLEIKGL